MKKRIALAAAFALAISVGGMLPALAAKPGAPVVGTATCQRTTSTLEIKATTSLNVSVISGVLAVTGGTASCPTDYGVFTGLTTVVLKSTASITFDLEGWNASVDTPYSIEQVANYRGVAFTAAATGDITFDGASLGNTFYGVNGLLSEEAFTLGSLTGTYYAGDELSFLGGAAGDTFDASTVTTTIVDLQGNGGNDTLKGGAGNDHLDGGDGDDVMYGNAGDDTFDTADLEAMETPCLNPKDKPRNWSACYSGGSGGSDQAWGGAGNDYIAGDLGDTVAPGDGNDQVVGNIDALIYVDSSAGITINLKTNPGRVTSTAGNDYFTSDLVHTVEGVTYALNFVGSELADTFIGTDAMNTFYGGSGGDTIEMNGGDDFVSAQGGADSVRMGAGDDFVYGDTGADKINGGDGDDEVRGMGGDDVIYGSTGDDKLLGGKGSDQTWGGRGIDNCAGEVMDSCEFKR